jgi:ferredoxin
MPQKYSIHTKPAPPKFYPVGKYATIEFRENCAGSCKECVKKKCVYDIFKNNYLHMSKMEEPEYLYTCNSCFRCIQECTKGIFSRVINPEYREIGDEYYTPDVINRTWYQAHTGGIPVSGAGYRGPFAGKGFDSMWTDMSEIVRPTRDGIHGREYINTCIELSRRPERLAFHEDGSLAVEVKPILEIPLPIIFQKPKFGVLSKKVLVSMLKAAQTIGTKMFMDAAEIDETFESFGTVIIPVVKKENFHEFTGLLKRSDMVEIDYEPGIEPVFDSLRAINENLVISVGLPLSANLNYAEIGVDLSNTAMDTLHVYTDYNGREFNSQSPRFIKDMLRDIHVALVKAGTRRQINILASGGVSMAEHVNKTIICGADGVVIDRPLLLAMECRLCTRCRNGLSCPVKLEDIDPEYGSNRIINLMGAWRNQMLEMLGAMGMREARRLRGEVGRSMWFEDLEKDSFGPIFGERKIALDVG